METPQAAESVSLDVSLTTDIWTESYIGKRQYTIPRRRCGLLQGVSYRASSVHIDISVHV